MSITFLKRSRDYIPHSFVGFMVCVTVIFLRFVDKEKINILNKADEFADQELFDYCIIFMKEVSDLRKSKKYPVAAIKLSLDVLDNIQNAVEFRDYIEESPRPHRVYLSLMAGHKYRRQFGLNMLTKIQSMLLFVIVKACRCLPAIYHYARFRLGLVRIYISDDLIYTLAYHIYNRGIDYPFNDYDDYSEYWCTDIIVKLADGLMDDLDKLDEFRCEVELPLRCELSQTRRSPNFITLRRLMYRMRDNIHLHIVKYLRHFDTCVSRSTNNANKDQYAYDLTMAMHKYWITNNHSQILTKIIEGGFLDDLKMMAECKQIIDQLPHGIIFQIEDYRKYRDSFTEVRRCFIMHG